MSLIVNHGKLSVGSRGPYADPEYPILSTTEISVDFDDNTVALHSTERLAKSPGLKGGVLLHCVRLALNEWFDDQAITKMNFDIPMAPLVMLDRCNYYMRDDWTLIGADLLRFSMTCGDFTHFYDHDGAALASFQTDALPLHLKA